MTTNLPLGYNRDLQLLKEVLFPAIADLRSCLSMAAFMLGNIRVKEHILDDPKYDYLFSVETVNIWSFRACRSAKPTAGWGSTSSRVGSSRRGKCTIRTKAVSAIRATTRYRR